MVRRAFGRAFGDDEIEDLYGNAWLGTLRALRSRRDELSDAELRRYVLTAVANQASKELRRRGRRPTASLELARGVPDAAPSPDERAAGREESRIARDLLATLPPRRRAVMLFRYGWGLEPREVCRLIEGLSHRAYRKEITRGVDEITEKLRLVYEGRWCKSRESLLKAYAAHEANEVQRRQAEHHLAHCRHCADYVGKLSGHLHELGGSIAWTGAAEAVGPDGVSLLDRFGELSERARESLAGVFTRSSGESGEIALQAASSGGSRGAGLGAAGGLAKLAGAGAVPKLVAACVGTGAAATACVAAGVAPLNLPDTGEKQAAERGSERRPDRGPDPLSRGSLPSQLGHEAPATHPPDAGEQPAARPAPAPVAAEPPPPAPPPPVQREFGLAPESATGGSSGGNDGAGTAGGTAGGGGSSGGGSAAVGQEFGP